ncbi:MULTISPECIES: methyltransferase domain-containing protein [unclassified Methylobacterium]|uniref:methyltransferase domain-containing protein n=1 Tax=unclassified Methylobacterium TaxID=2615210 RepID=UPI00070075B9|nr:MULTISPECIES: methyltransferase domain-containing protein [unclassified Methylobacterium]KQO49231.1 methyltransferase type 12 [Methylobacterium sp. Leaf86]KQP00544.1 methyltransferase type 12 [Methylobacterium sp. Leaf91]
MNPRAQTSLQNSSGDLLADRRYAYAEACLSEGDAEGAAEMAEQVLEIAPRYAAAWFLLGRAREARHLATADVAHHHAALRAYGNALDLDPHDELGARLRLVQIGEGAALGAISPAYIRALFDGYAPRFERHLVGELQYRGPELLVRALDGLDGARADFGDVIDLGCGTGLVGEALNGRTRTLMGIDISPGMLTEAARRRRYDRLIEGDLVPILRGGTRDSADLVIAADVFIYVGGLSPVMAETARILRPTGLVAFTVQWNPDGGLVLGADARYAHGERYLRRLADEAGLDMLGLEPAVIRRERGSEVPARVVLLRKPGPPAP